MNLPDLKQLERIIALCRRKGVKSIKIDNVELTLSDDAPISAYKQTKASKQETPVEDTVQFQSDSLSQEALLFWSTGGGDGARDEDTQ